MWFYNKNWEWIDTHKHLLHQTQTDHYDNAPKLPRFVLNKNERYIKKRRNYIRVHQVYDIWRKSLTVSKRMRRQLKQMRAYSFQNKSISRHTESYLHP